MSSCPNCRQPADLSANNPWRPFCSERCKLIDLGEWFEESRGIPSEQPADWPATEDQSEDRYQ